VARGFKRTRHGVRARLDDSERELLAQLFVEVHAMLLDDAVAADDDPLAVLVGIGTAVDLPADPAIARLLPDAHRDDPDASAEFRRYTETGLRGRKREALELARRTLARHGALTLDDAEAQAWVRALTDVRLVLASRMGLETDEDHQRLMMLAAAELQSDELLDGSDGSDGALDEPQPPRRTGPSVGMLLAVYDFLTWLQETLVEALLEPLPRD
jgi:hypothetical protein